MRGMKRHTDGASFCWARGGVLLPLSNMSFASTLRPILVAMAEPQLPEPTSATFSRGMVRWYVQSWVASSRKIWNRAIPFASSAYGGRRIQPPRRKCMFVGKHEGNPAPSRRPRILESRIQPPVYVKRGERQRGPL